MLLLSVGSFVGHKLACHIPLLLPTRNPTSCWKGEWNLWWDERHPSEKNKRFVQPHPPANILDRTASKRRPTIKLTEDLDQHHARLLLAPKGAEIACISGYQGQSGHRLLLHGVKDIARAMTTISTELPSSPLLLWPQRREKHVANKTARVERRPWGARNQGPLHWETPSPLPFPGKRHVKVQLKQTPVFRVSPLFWGISCPRRSRGMAQVHLGLGGRSAVRKKWNGGRKTRSPKPWPKPLAHRDEAQQHQD